ncbi:hypothetical protein BU17DRAFT_101973 [Hysterangium stoloniferum]|nr:hypothetical protein BU17DRAFT_101973 [Hysterangium stoloniferum]
MALGKETLPDVIFNIGKDSEVATLRGEEIIGVTLTLIAGSFHPGLAWTAVNLKAATSRHRSGLHL